MENIKEELRQMIKDKILSTIMEGKKSEKPIHAPRGASTQRPKSWNKGSKDGTRQTQERQKAAKEIARQMSESREDVLKSLNRSTDGKILTDFIEKRAKELAAKPKSSPRGPSVDIKDLKVSDLLSRYKSLIMKNKKA
jgi:translation initiation factor 2 beta subunit (eIF-2beta)/eIF-5